MRETLLPMICCPACRSAFTLQTTETEGEDIITGTLTCNNCMTPYPITKRMPHLINNALLEGYKAQEMQGWVSLWEKKGMYEEETLQHVRHSLELPYVGGRWTETARLFDLIMAELNLQGSETILDLGAGQGWAARRFAEKGCNVIATDIVADETYGLGWAWNFMEHAKTYFEPMLADGERLPFPDDTFDVVFFAHALHHFKDFATVLQEVQRVLKPGGRMIALSEPTIPIFMREKDVQHLLEEEVEQGIVERRAWSVEYWWKSRQAGLRNIQIDTVETYNAESIQLYSWIVAARMNLFKAIRPRYKPLVWLTYSFALLLPPRLAAQLALCLNGGNILLRAWKPRTSGRDFLAKATTAHGTKSTTR